MSALKLSDGFSALLTDLSSFRDLPDNEQAKIAGADARKLYAILQAMHSLSVNMEIELACFRDMEAGREFHAATETASIDTLSTLLFEAGGNVIRPDFGGKKK